MPNLLNSPFKANENIVKMFLRDWFESKSLNLKLISSFNIVAQNIRNSSLYLEMKNILA